MITYGTFHGGQQILSVVTAEQCQHTLGLTFSTTLFLQQAFQEAACHIAQFRKLLAELFQLLGMVRGRTMRRIDLFFARRALNVSVRFKNDMRAALQNRQVC